MNFVRTLKDDDWQALGGMIRLRRCVPILGAEACDRRFSLYETIAADWATEHAYPFEDRTNLARVAQYVTSKRNALLTKEEFIERLQAMQPPDAYFKSPCEPHNLLANLHLPMYLTTNYDNYMFRALTLRNWAPKEEYCRWTSALKRKPPLVDWNNAEFPQAATPLVYHLNGLAAAPDSLALTEDDYLDLLANVSRETEMIPSKVRKALAENSLLFLGFRLTDWDFRVLIRCIAEQMGLNDDCTHVAVQLSPFGPAATQEEIGKAVEILDKYFGRRNVQVFWGSCQEFVMELCAKLPGLCS